jgi:multidrug efflux pump subunit AcrA (membrane-fusion protein)
MDAASSDCAEQWAGRDCESWLSPIAFYLLAIFSLASLACRSDYPASAKQNQGAQQARRVKTVRPVERLLEQTIPVIGALAPYDQATLRVKVSGRLQALAVDLGSRVRRGQLIAQIEQRDYQLKVQQAEAALAQARAHLGLPPEGSDDGVDPEQTAAVRQARATLEEARANYERAKQLLEKGVISRAQYDSAEAAHKVALSRYQDAVEEVRNRQALLSQRRSELELARQQLADTNIYAPFDGVVQERHSSVGEFLAVGAPVVTVVRIDPLRLRAEVPERESHKVRAGQKVRVAVEGNQYVYSGQIVRLSPTIAAQNRMLVVEAEVRNDGQLRPGSFARVEIVTEEKKKALTLPPSAVQSFAGVERVVVVLDGRAVEKPVAIGRRTQEWVEVLSGIGLGDQVILEPDNIQAGQAVIAQG